MWGVRCEDWGVVGNIHKSANVDWSLRAPDVIVTSHCESCLYLAISSMLRQNIEQLLASDKCLHWAFIQLNSKLIYWTINVCWRIKVSKIMEINLIKSSVLNSINEPTAALDRDTCLLTDTVQWSEGMWGVSWIRERDHNNTLTIKIGILISLWRIIKQDNVGLVVITL